MAEIVDTKDLGLVVRARRKELGMRQDELALAANTSVRFVSELERGKPTVRLENVLRVVSALGLRIAIGR